ncbi:copper amine oxidase N-terminal domain-containing protein [Paenibacillus hamazuiensis]|uniref:copper amine oxidase N-terminal domain-containing protein n=1 Tax=Paenibacillus hamazuiensis TaxID=2936508 RepID=UPI00200C45AD|nr:copper amine oxidase N-terminal domain-containing protein [Paenibacillus hamazuiensis]
MKKSLKKKALSAMAGLLLWGALAGQAAFAETGKVNVYYNGELLQFGEAQPVIKDGNTLVPFRKLFETLGFTVKWEDKGDIRKAIGTKDGLDIELVIDGGAAKVNGKEVKLEVPAQIIDGNTMVPLRFVSENSGNEVAFSNEGGEAVIQIGKGQSKDQNKNQNAGEAACKNPAASGDKAVFLAMINAYNKAKSYSYEGTMKMSGSGTDMSMTISGDVNLHPEYAQHIKSSTKMGEFATDQESIILKDKMYMKSSMTGGWQAVPAGEGFGDASDEMSKYFSCAAIDAIKDIKVKSGGSDVVVDVIYDVQKWDALSEAEAGDAKTTAFEQHYVLDAGTSLPKSAAFTLETKDENGTLKMEAEYTYKFSNDPKKIEPPAGVK